MDGTFATMSEHIKIPDEPTLTHFAPTDPQSVFQIPWPCFDKADIRVVVDDVEANQGEFSFTGNSGTEGGFDGATITFNQPVEDCDVYIYRNIPLERTDDFGAGPLSSRDRNTLYDRFMAMLQDRRLEGERAITIPFGEESFSIPRLETRKGKYLKFDSVSGKIVGVDVIVSGSGGGTIDDADIAAALNAAIEADASAALAEAERILAQAAVTSATAQAVIATTQANNSSNYANAALTYKNAAGVSADEASSSAAAAESEKAAAETAHAAAVAAKDLAVVAKSDAQSAAATATTKASLAATSETNAGNSASAAATSASTASTKATEASNSASSASTHANTAASEASDAAASAADSASSAGNASSSASSAATSASNAASSASSATTQATNAANSSTAAGTSASAASTSASSAQTYAGQASSSATSASSSANTANAKSIEAASSATAAASSAATAATDAATATTKAALVASYASEVDGRLTIAEAAITSEATTRASADTALSTSITNLTTTVNDNKSTYDSFVSSQTTSNSSFTSSLNTLSAQVAGTTSSGLKALITTEQTARADADDALALDITTLETTVGDNKATYDTFASTQSTWNSAQTSWNAALTAQMAGTSSSGLKALVTSEATARASGDSALATSISTLEATVNDNKSTYDSHVTAQTTQNGTFATQITSLQSSYASLNSSVTTQAGTISNINGKLAAYYGISVDAGTGQASFKLIADGTEPSTIELSADQIVMHGDVVIDGTLTTAKVGPNQITSSGGATTAGPTSASSGSWTTIHTETVVTLGGLVDLFFSTVSNPPDINADVSLDLRLRRNGSVTIYQASGLQQPVYAASAYRKNTTAILSAMYQDSPAAGTHTYTLEVQAYGGTFSESNSTILYTELKR